MFKNESRVIRRMLESCAPYIDFWVIQNNGSTDGTDEIVKDFFKENPIPGVLYNVEEGWVGFGWNRDHLIRTCQSLDHGCDWIIKMDCDEILKVDSNFDWSILDDTSVQAWHVTAELPPHLYQRAWMYNAKLPWRFDHDPCHETVYCDIDNIGHHYQTRDLPYSFRQFGFREGQSYEVSTKYVSDSLKLEEKMIRENTIFTDTYHFWYIGKSYFDAYQSNAFPLGEGQKKEYGRRTIYYLKTYVNYRHGVFDGKSITHVDELSYMGLVYVGEVLKDFGEYDEAEQILTLSEGFSPERNDHLIMLYSVFEVSKQYDKLLECANRMIDPNRINPFPKYNVFINSAHYVNTGNYVHELHQKAQWLVEQTNQTEKLPFYINTLATKKLFVVDDYYCNPDEIRNFAYQQEFKSDIRFYKGLRTTRTYRPTGLKESFEKIIGQEIINWEHYEHNGVFQITTAEDPQVYHHDLQRWAGMIYLTPDAPYESGTRLHISKINGASNMRQGMDKMDEAFSHGFYDSTKFYNVDYAGNVYNRLVIMDAQNLHSAGNYFGKTPETGRLIHLFFFD